MCARPPTAQPACREAAVAATRLWRALAALGSPAARRPLLIAARCVRALFAADDRPACADAARLAGLVGGVLAAAGAKGADLPEDRADTMFHLYDGGGVTALGPAVLIRKSLFDRVSLTGSYFVDIVSNASIDVVTTASPYHETRKEAGLGLDYVYHDATISLSGTHSKEPDYTADSTSVDVTQDVFGGMTTVSIGYTRGWDTVGKHGSPTFSASANHWQYRLGATQVLTPRWLMSLNLESVSDQGYLQSPYRVARLFGAAIPERDPSTRTGRAALVRVVGDIGSRGAVRVQYRYFWDTWDISAHTAELGYSRHLGERWLVDAYFRYYKQNHALFYGDNFTAERTYMSRNRQLSTFWDAGPGLKTSYSVGRYASRFDVKVNAAYQWLRFQYSDFTDIRNGKLYSFNASVLELQLSATY
jgi:hypothetical protein